jgi:hypothetical protein
VNPSIGAMEAIGSERQSNGPAGGIRRNASCGERRILEPTGEQPLGKSQEGRFLLGGNLWPGWHRSFLPGAGKVDPNPFQGGGEDLGQPRLADARSVGFRGGLRAVGS